MTVISIMFYMVSSHLLHHLQTLKLLRLTVKEVMFFSRNVIDGFINTQTMDVRLTNLDAKIMHFF